MSVGVIVPVYDETGGARYLPQALEGVLSQDPAPEEVIVVDDCSPAPVVLTAVHAERCRLIRRERRGGPGPARDTALDQLRTDFVACADADDIWRAGKLHAQLRAFEREPEVVLCFGAAVVVDASGEPTGERWQAIPAGVLAPDRLAPQLFEHNPIPTSSTMIRRAALEAAGGFSGPPLCEDWALWLRLLALGGRFLSEPDAVVCYRRHPRGATSDIAALAESSLLIHAAHAALVDGPTRKRVRAADLTALARGRVRQRRYAEARSALQEAALLAPAGAGEQALAAALKVPGLRRLLGHRRPY